MLNLRLARCLFKGPVRNFLDYIHPSTSLFVFCVCSSSFQLRPFFRWPIRPPGSNPRMAHGKRENVVIYIYRSTFYLSIYLSIYLILYVKIFMVRIISIYILATWPGYLLFTGLDPVFVLYHVYPSSDRGVQFDIDLWCHLFCLLSFKFITFFDCRV